MTNNGKLNEDIPNTEKNMARVAKDAGRRKVLGFVWPWTWLHLVWLRFIMASHGMASPTHGFTWLYMVWLSSEWSVPAVAMVLVMVFTCVGSGQCVGSA